MADVHRPAKIFGRPIRLEEWFDQLAGAVIKFVFVRVNDLETFLELRMDDFERARTEQVVMIEKADIPSAGQIECLIRRGADTTSGRGSYSHPRAHVPQRFKDLRRFFRL